MRKNTIHNKTDLFRHHLITAAVSACFAGGALANPFSPTVISGQAGFSTLGNTLTVTNSPGAIINWQGFSIGTGETTRFIQQSASSAVLNRVVGQDPSSILGTLQSNGRVFLLNPNGIVFGQGAQINVAGLVASTLNLSDQDFVNNRLRFTEGAGRGGITNQGAITTQSGGQVYLVAPNIQNSGVITAPGGDVLLAAGHTVDLVDPSNPYISVAVTAPDTQVVNLGQIVTQGGRTGIYAGLITQGGTVSADSAVVGENGKIIFKASKDVTLASGSVTTASGAQGGQITVQSETGTTMVSGTVAATGSSGKGGDIRLLGQQVGLVAANVDASGDSGGGTVLVGGDYRGQNPAVQNARAAYVGTDAVIKADAVSTGDGGKVIVWSDEATRTYGTISAKGGALSGNGGFVETSGHYLDVAGINVDAQSPQGKGGTWLLDPYDITIGPADSNISAGPTFTATASPSTVAASTIAAQLNAGTSVVVDTTGAGVEQGNITVASAISKTSGTAASLTLLADNTITVNASISSSSSTLGVTFTADKDTNNSGAIFINAPINTNGGNVTISSYGDIALNAGTTNINAPGGTVSLTSTGGAIQGDPMGAPLDIFASSVALNAKTGIAANGGSAQFSVDAGTINFSNTTSGLVRIRNDHAGASSFTGSNTGGNVILESFDSANPTTINNVSASGDIVFRVNNINVAGPVNAGANTVYLAPLSFNSPVSVGGTSAFDLSGAEISNISAGKIVVGYDTFGNYASSATIGASSAQTITNAANLEVWVANGGGIATGPNGLTNSGGNVTLKGGSMSLDGAVDVGAGTIALTATSGGITGAGPLTAGNLRIESASLVNLTGANAVAQLAATTANGGDFTFNNGTTNLNIQSNIGGLTGISTGGTISLTTTGAITQSAGALISGAAFVANGGSVLLTEANSTGVIAGTTMGGDFVYRSSNPIQVSTIGGVSGITTTGKVRLQSASDIGQTAGANIVASGLALEGNGSVWLTSTGNNVGVVAADLYGGGTGTGQFHMKNTGALVVGTVTTDHAVSGIATNSQAATIENSGSLSVSSAIDTHNSTDYLYLNAIGAASDLTISANITNGSGAANLNAGRDVIHSGGAVSSSGPIWISAANSFTHSAGSITTSYVPGATYDDGIGIKANNMAISAPISAQGAISLNPYSLTQAIDIGGADSAGTLGLSAADLGNLSANGGKLFIGDINGYSGNIQLSGAVTIDPAKFSGVYMGTAGSVTDTAGAQLTANALYVKGDSGVNLGNTSSGHAVNTFGAYGPTGVSFKGSGSFAVDGVDASLGDASLTSVSGSINDFNGIGVNNIIATNLTVTPSPTGNIDLDYLITGTLTQGATSGTVSLRPFGTSAMVQSSINTITATTNTTTSVNTSNPVTSATDSISPIDVTGTTAETDVGSTSAGTTGTTATDTASSASSESGDGTKSSDEGQKESKDSPGKDGKKDEKKDAKKPAKC